MFALFLEGGDRGLDQFGVDGVDQSLGLGFDELAQPAAEGGVGFEFGVEFGESGGEFSACGEVDRGVEQGGAFLEEVGEVAADFVGEGDGGVFAEFLGDREEDIADVDVVEGQEVDGVEVDDVEVFGFESGF